MKRKLQRGGLQINRRQGERIFFFLGGVCLGQLTTDSDHAALTAKFGQDVIVKREELLTPNERLAAHV